MTRRALAAGQCAEDAAVGMSVASRPPRTRQQPFTPPLKLFMMHASKNASHITSYEAPSATTTAGHAD